MNQNLKWTMIKAFAWVPDPIYIFFQHRFHLGFFPNLKNPKSYSEAFMKLKLEPQVRSYIKYTHKHDMKSWIASQVGEEWVIPTQCVLDHLDKKILKELPMPYIIKPTLGSQENAVIKSVEDVDLLNLKLRPHHLLYRERNYQGKRDWIIEPLLDKLENIYDIKAHCFYGKVVMFQVSLNNKSKSRCMIDRQGNIIPYPFASGAEDHFDIKYHSLLPQLIDVAEKLSQPFTFLRVDFMVSPHGCVIGELTFFPQGGYSLRKDKAMNKAWISYFNKEASND
ncbi:MAG: hypothetical protein KGZ51_00055 [Erysipelothrix sp.]|jgi:hypothetical protein|nr:hypothetical protein [Erysipelothrix sp.]